MIKKFMIILLLLLLWLQKIIIGIGFHDIPGIYCGKRSPTCCPNRDDQCTMAILGNHLCYCDMFCDRGEYGNDCCPDFKAVCRYSQRTLAPGQYSDCIHDGITYSEGDTITRNCNQCN
uniref:SMB domain-containing protein n=1 Tax=Wuchereria bancrofti TaxID=6293 RepID=A0A1I8E9C4_WUCBA